MSYSVFSINWKHLKLMFLVRLISCNCSTNWTFHLALTLLLWPLHCLFGKPELPLSIFELSMIKYASVYSQWNFSNNTVVFLFYRILSHNKIRILRNGSFFGLYALEKLWVAYYLSSFMIISLLQILKSRVYCWHGICRMHPCVSCYFSLPQGLCRVLQTGYQWDLSSSVRF